MKDKLWRSGGLAAKVAMAGLAWSYALGAFPTVPVHSLMHGTIVFTTGSSQDVYAMDLPSKRVHRLRIEGIDATEVITDLSGPYKGGLVINTLGNCYYVRIAGSSVHRAKRLPGYWASLGPDGLTVSVVDNLQEKDHQQTGDLCLVDLRNWRSKTIVHGGVVGRMAGWNPNGTDLVAIIDTPSSATSSSADKRGRSVASQWMATQILLKSLKRTPLAPANEVRFLRINVALLGLGGHNSLWIEPKPETVPVADRNDFIFAEPQPGLELTWDLSGKGDTGAPLFGKRRSMFDVEAEQYAIRVSQPGLSRSEALVRVNAGHPSLRGPDGFAVCFSAERLSSN